jgi:hypothetical protein
MFSVQELRDMDDEWLDKAAAQQFGEFGDFLVDFFHPSLDRNHATRLEDEIDTKGLIGDYLRTLVNDVLLGDYDSMDSSDVMSLAFARPRQRTIAAILTLQEAQS